MTGLLVDVGNAACWGVVALVWVAGALYNVSHAPRGRARSQFELRAGISVVVACLILMIVGRGRWPEPAVGASWVRLLGLALLVASTAFTVWARLALGTMWSVAPKVKDDHRLRTHGPYAVTRHPIYTGLLGMLLGTTLLSGVGRWIVLFPIGLIVAEIKIRAEERLMVATFPDEYARYRGRVPRLVPGLRALGRRRRSAGGR
jgi:protein-S-isoprenylcysteine O-methyltransferase Ste14